MVGLQALAEQGRKRLMCLRRNNYFPVPCRHALPCCGAEEESQEIMPYSRRGISGIFLWQNAIAVLVCGSDICGGLRMSDLPLLLLASRLFCPPPRLGREGMQEA